MSKLTPDQLIQASISASMKLAEEDSISKPISYTADERAVILSALASNIWLILNRPEYLREAVRGVSQSNELFRQAIESGLFDGVLK